MKPIFYSLSLCTIVSSMYFRVVGETRDGPLTVLTFTMSSKDEPPPPDNCWA